MTLWEPALKTNKLLLTISFRLHLIISKSKKKNFFTKKRTQNIAYPRQIAMYLCREMADFSYPRIGEFFGGRDHTTVIHAYEKIVKRSKKILIVKKLLLTL